MLTLTVYRGDRIVQELDLEGPEVAIGRNAENHVVLPDDGKGVSRVHAVLRVEGGSYVLYDRDSQNGTFLEGKRIKRAVIQPGQDFVIGPYRLVLMPGETVEADPGPAGTVVASRSTPPPVSPATARESTARRAAPAQTQQKATMASATSTSRAGAASPQAWLSRQRPSVLYSVGGVGVALLAAVLIWQLWPAPPPEPALVSLTTTTTTLTTTSIPELPVDPHAEQIATAEGAMAAAESTFAARRYAAAATAFDRIMADLLPVLTADPQHVQALDLQTRAAARATEARRLDTPKPLPPLPKRVDPDAVATRQNESEQDYDRRNKEAQQDYALGKRLLSEGDYLAALKIFGGLATREPGWLDVSAYLKNSQAALDEARQQVLNEGLRLEKVGYDADNERRLAEAASAFIGASKAFERAAALQDPKAEKLLADNLDRRRRLAKAALESARTHANNKNRSEATKLFQVIVDVLPPGEPLRLEAQSDLRRLGPGGE